MSAVPPAMTIISSQREPVGFRKVVRDFTPNWFAATMGTGILAIALAQFPQALALRQIGELLWMANSVLFALFSVLLLARCVLFFRQFGDLLRHPVMSMFFGCIPMGLATIVNGFLIYGVPHFGAAAVSIAQTLWWIDVLLSLACGFAIPLAMFTRQAHAIESMTAVWLLPLVASGVAAVSGGLLVPGIDGADAQMAVLVTSLILWSCSIPIALGILVILFLRMALHRLPEANMAASTWLSIGPIGTGALGLTLFSQVGGPVLAANGLGDIASAFSGAALLGAILLWAYGLWWLALAVIVTIRYIIRDGVPYNLGWWGYTFPLGVYAVSTLKLAHALDFAPLMAFGAGLVILLALAWIIVACRTVAFVLSGFPRRHQAFARVV